MNFDELVSVPIGQLETANRRHLAIIGASGSGKTTWAVKADDALVLVAEKQAIGRIQETNPNARVLVVDSISKIRDIYKWLIKEVFPGGTPRKKGWVPKYIVLDSLTEICRFKQDELSGDDKDWTFRTWKKYEDGCMRLFRNFRDLPVTLIATCLDEVHEGNEGTMGLRRMDVGKKKMAPKVAGLFDCVFWMETKERTGDESGTVHAIRTEGGSYQGFKLEQGKGHPSLEKWLDASEFTPKHII